MAETPQETIQKAAEAYIAGRAGDLSAQLAEGARVRGSHRTDRWDDARSAVEGLGDELRRRDGQNVAGPLVNFEEQPVDIRGEGDVVWSSRTGSISIDGVEIEGATWTTIVEKQKDDDWRIVHSHFSIHL